MAKILCVLYDDPIGGMPASYPRDGLPQVDRYPDGSSLPSPQAIDFNPGELLGSVSGELGLRKFVEERGHDEITAANALSSLERVAAAARGDGVRVVDLEPGLLDRLEVVDTAAAQMRSAERIDDHLDTLALELVVALLGAAVEAEPVLEPRAAARNDADAKAGPRPLGEGTGQLGTVAPSTPCPPRLVAPLRSADTGLDRSLLRGLGRADLVARDTAGMAAVRAGRLVAGDFRLEQWRRGAG